MQRPDDNMDWELTAGHRWRHWLLKLGIKNDFLNPQSFSSSLLFIVSPANQSLTPHRLSKLY
jgi:hypothetical protein